MLQKKLDEKRSISLCDCIYKLISKIISGRIKGILSKYISQEQFGFLEGRQIHEAIGVAQEAMHSIKTQRLKGAVLKIDLSKVYDQVSWIFLKLLLTFGLWIFLYKLDHEFHHYGFLRRAHKWDGLTFLPCRERAPTRMPSFPSYIFVST
jgi:hypothetical protein